MSSSNKIILVALCGASILLSGCASPAWQTIRNPLVIFNRGKKEEPNPHGRKRIWNGDDLSGPPLIVIELGAQRALFYKGKQLAGETDISSGRSGYDTPPGRYRVIEKDADHRSSLYGEIIDSNGDVVIANADSRKHAVPPGGEFIGASMPYFLRFQHGYGLHAGHLPGRPASHGCVRLPISMAEHFFDNAPLGTPVKVLP